jgi:hypothetical protein
MRDPIRRGKRGRLGAFAFAAAFAILAGAAPAANAAFGISSFSAAPANNDAGANSNLSISFDVQDPSAQIKDLIIHLPPGLVGNPLATPTCTEAKLNNDNCPAASKVGTISNTVNLIGVPLPVTASGNIYNVVPRKGEPARFGFVLTTPGNILPPIILQSPASLRQSDFGLDTTLDDIPNKVSGLSIDITNVQLTLKGKVGSPAKGFLRNPTSCGPHTVGIDADAYDSQSATASTTFNTDKCNALPFSPEFSARIKQLNADPLNPVELSTTIAQTIKEAGLRKAVVTLPTEVIGNSGALSIRCSIADFDAGSCADDTVVGDAVAASPLQAKPLTGKVYLVEPATVSPFPDLGIDLKGGLALKVKGTLSATSVNGGIQIFVTFDGLPDIPLSEFTLTFSGGPGGLNLVSRSPCEPPPFTFNADFLGHSGQTLNTDVNPTTKCAGSGGGKRPRAAVKLGKLKHGNPRVALRLKAGAAELRKTKVSLPKGLKVGPKRKFKRGTKVSGASIRGKGRKLRVKAKGGGADRIKVKLSKGAIVAKHGVKAKRLKPFKLKIRDADGKLTKLAVSAR